MLVPPKFITTDGGEELVILGRHEYESILAQLDAERVRSHRSDASAESPKPELVGPYSGSTDTWSIEERLALGNRIAAARKVSGIGRRDLIGKAGLKLTELSAIERGIGTCSFATLAQLALALGVEFRELRG